MIIILPTFYYFNGLRLGQLNRQDAKTKARTEKKIQFLQAAQLKIACEPIPCSCVVFDALSIAVLNHRWKGTVGLLKVKRHTYMLVIVVILIYAWHTLYQMYNMHNI